MRPGRQVFVMNHNQKRETGRKAQLKYFGSKGGERYYPYYSRTKVDAEDDDGPDGGIVMTNDGNCILRSWTFHPAAKSMIELSRAQDEEVGDGTTSVIVLAGEMLKVAEPFLRGQDAPHPGGSGVPQGHGKGDRCLRLYRQAIRLQRHGGDDNVIELREPSLSADGDRLSSTALTAVRRVLVVDEAGKNLLISSASPASKRSLEEKWRIAPPSTDSCSTRMSRTPRCGDASKIPRSSS